jgi:hypothetical protein
VFSSPLFCQPLSFSSGMRSRGERHPAFQESTYEASRSKCSVLHCLSVTAQYSDPKYSPPSDGVAFSALLIAAGTVGLGGALSGIFTAGDEDNEDRKLRSIQGLSGSVLPLN